MPQYNYNGEDGYSDPALIAARYRIDRSVFFEVELVTGELQESQSSLKGTAFGDIGVIQALNYEGEGSEHFGCPEEDQYVWVGVQGEDPVPVKAFELLENDYSLYNPVTRSFNRLKRKWYIKDAAMLRVDTTRGRSSVVTDSHMMITGPMDKKGIPLIGGKVRDSILSFEYVRQRDKNRYNIYSDQIYSISEWGRGNGIGIELEAEYLYIIGWDRDGGTVAHNKKDENLLLL